MKCTSENSFKPLFSKREEISPFALAVWVWVGDIKLWAGHHQRWTASALLWRKVHVTCNEGFLELKKQYLEVNYTFGVAIRITMLCLVANTLVWPNVYDLRKKYEKYLLDFCNLIHKLIQGKKLIITWAPGDFPGRQIIPGKSKFWLKCKSL